MSDFDPGKGKSTPRAYSQFKDSPPSLPRNTCEMPALCVPKSTLHEAVHFLAPKKSFSPLHASAYDVNRRRDLRRERSTREHMHRIGAFDAGKLGRFQGYRRFVGPDLLSSVRIPGALCECSVRASIHQRNLVYNFFRDR